MKAHVLQHVAFEDIGSIAGWLRARAAEVSVTRFYQDARLPDLKDLDLIIAMGGPMSVNDESEVPWLRSEKQFVRDAIERGIPTLGICLGAQMIASALGSRVYRNTVKEIGWFPIEAVPAAPGSFKFPSTCKVFHWHGETFDLPPGAVLLAKSAGCRNQAFQLKQNVIGLQFHLEITPEGTHAILGNCSNELVPGPYIQSREELSTIRAEAYYSINRLMEHVLSYVTGTGV